jgi:hypothetical protein
MALEVLVRVIEFGKGGNEADFRRKAVYHIT